MGSLELLGTEFAVTRYEHYLKKTAEMLHNLAPTSIISLARKGPRLLQLMKEMGISIPDVPHWSDHALDFLTQQDLGTSPIIFDDVVILGTSIHSLQKRIRKETGRIPHVVAVIADADNFRKEFVEDFHPTVFLDSPNVQAFSSELIRAIPLLGLPYDLDHPIFTFDHDESQKVLDELLSKATHAHKEFLTAQHEDKVDVISLHFQHNLSSNPMLHNLNLAIGTLDLFKIKIIRSRLNSDIRFVPVCCFAPMSKTKLKNIWIALNLPEMRGNCVAMYRCLCFYGAMAYASACIERMDSTSLLKDEAVLTLAAPGLQAVEAIHTALSSADVVLNQIGSQDNIAGVDFADFLPDPSLDLSSLVPPRITDTDSFEYLSDFWRCVFDKIELPFRAMTKEILDRGGSVDEILALKEAKRLKSGFPASYIFRILKLENSLDRSLAFDLAVDAGIQVPIYSETQNDIARVYHHGESVWEGYRFCSLIAKVFDKKKHIFPTIAKIKAEKYLHVLYELTEGSSKQALFIPVRDFLHKHHVGKLAGKIQVDSDWRVHGVTLGVADKLRGLLRPGGERYGVIRPAVYWLANQGVFLERDGFYVLNPRAVDKFHCNLNMAADEYRPATKLFEYLEKGLPASVRTTSVSGKDLEWSHDDIIRLISSCPNTTMYLRSIAEDAVLMADDWSMNYDSDEIFVASKLCREASGEIFRKTLVYLSREKIFQALHQYAESKGTDDDFDLLITPLFQEKDGSLDQYGKRKIEDRCQIVFICVESIALEGTTSDGKKRKSLIEWLIKNKGFQIPNNKAERITLAKRTCSEIIDMFPTLINSLMNNKEIVGDEFYLFSDMRDSSLPGAEGSAERAKKALIGALDDMAKIEGYDNYRQHFNNDLNDEKNVFTNSKEFLTKTFQKITRIYSSHGKYARIGLVTNRDTLQNAIIYKNLPSASTNYSLAKKIGHILQSSEDKTGTIEHRSLDIRHTDQKYGIIAVSQGSMSFLKIEDVVTGKHDFASLEDFLASTQEGWTRVAEKSIEIGPSPSPKLGFSVYLYR